MKIPRKDTTKSLMDSFNWKTIYIIKNVFPIIISNTSHMDWSQIDLGNSDSKGTVITLYLGSSSYYEKGKK